MRTFLVCVLVFAAWLIPALAQGDECRLLGLISRIAPEYLPTNPDVPANFTALRSQSTANGPDGWGIAYYPTGSTKTGPGTVWFNDEVVEPQANRFASNEVAADDEHFTDAQGVVYGTEADPVHAVIAHVRNATSTPVSIPDPHPFIYETEERDYSFAFHGTVETEHVRPFMLAQIAQIREDQNWEPDPEIDGMVALGVDSGIYCAYLMTYIRLHNWNILQGLHDALSQGGANEEGWSMNFIMSDGDDLYGFRRRDVNDSADDHELKYKIDSLFGFAAIRTEADADFTALDDKDLIYIPRLGDPVLFKYFPDTSAMKLVKSQAPRGSAIENYWLWESFPVLNPNATAAEVMTQATETGGSGFGYTEAEQVLYEENHAISYDGSLHHWTGNIDQFSQIDGYKIFVPNSDIHPEIDPPARILGSLVDQDAEVTLLPGQENWVGYWLLNSQTLEEALGDDLMWIRSVKSGQWAYMTPESPSGNTDPPDRSLGDVVSYKANQVMEFGKMYVIRLKDRVTEPLSFHWTNSRTGTPLSATHPIPPQHYPYPPAPDYEVIDIIGLDPTTTTEVGVFAGDDCIGAATVTDSVAQVLVYSAGYEGVPLHFEYYSGDRSAQTASPRFASYNPITGKFTGESLTAGGAEHKIVRIGAPDPTESAKTPLAISYSAAPNPFNPQTRVSFTLPVDGVLDVQVYNLRGQHIATLANGDFTAGDHALVWNGTNDAGRNVASGLYFCRIRFGGATTTGKLLLMK
jgi:hypothetical protein